MISSARVVRVAGTGRLWSSGAPPAAWATSRSPYRSHRKSGDAIDEAPNAVVGATDIREIRGSLAGSVARRQHPARAGLAAGRLPPVPSPAPAQHEVAPPVVRSTGPGRVRPTSPHPVRGSWAPSGRRSACIRETPCCTPVASPRLVRPMRRQSSCRPSSSSRQTTTRMSSG